MDEHKFQKNKKYYTVSIYAIITVAISAIVLKSIWHWAATLHFVNKILSVLSPFLIGLFIAYLMNPLVKTLDKNVFKRLLRIKKDSIRKVLSILISYIFVFGIIAICISVIVPEVYSSLKNIYEGVQGSYDKLVKFLDEMSTKHPNWDIQYISTVVKDNSSKIIDFVKGSLDTILPLLYNTSISVISWALNIIIAIMVSCYMLIDKNRLLLNCKRVIYAVLKKEHADSLSSTLSDCNKIFANFMLERLLTQQLLVLCAFYL